jgi:hypothetical protein
LRIALLFPVLGLAPFKGWRDVPTRDFLEQPLPKVDIFEFCVIKISKWIL